MKNDLISRLRAKSDSDEGEILVHRHKTTPKIRSNQHEKYQRIYTFRMFYRLTSFIFGACVRTIYSLIGVDVY